MVPLVSVLKTRSSVAYLAYLVRGGKQRHRFIFRMGGGGGGKS